MYVDIAKILKIPVILIGLVIVGFGVYKFITALSINQQIASTLVAIFGLQLMWFMLWIMKKGK